MCPRSTQHSVQGDDLLSSSRRGHVLGLCRRQLRSRHQLAAAPQHASINHCEGVGAGRASLLVAGAVGTNVTLQQDRVVSTAKSRAEGHDPQLPGKPPPHNNVFELRAAFPEPPAHKVRCGRMYTLVPLGHRSTLRATIPACVPPGGVTEGSAQPRAWDRGGYVGPRGQSGICQASYRPAAARTVGQWRSLRLPQSPQLGHRRTGPAVCQGLGVPPRQRLTAYLVCICL